MLNYFTALLNMRAWFFNTLLQLYVVASHGYWWATSGSFVWYQMVVSLILFILGSLIVYNRVQHRLWLAVWPGTRVTFNLSYSLLEAEAREWLDENIGNWNYHYVDRDYAIYFRRSQDAVAFRLAFV